MRPRLRDRAGSSSAAGGIAPARTPRASARRAQSSAARCIRRGRGLEISSRACEPCRQSDHSRCGRPPRPACCWAPFRRDAFPLEGLLTLADGGAVSENRAVGAREERLASNEALFREINERVAEVAERFVEVESNDDPVEFTCERGSTS